MTLAYSEADNDGAMSAGFSIAGGKSTRTYHLEVDEVDDLQAFISEFIGGTDLSVHAGKMNRIPPLADPEFPWMMASSIPTMKRNRGIPIAGIAEPELEVPAVSEYGFFNNWIAAVEFTPRKFPVVLDADVDLLSSSWYPDPNTDSTAALQSFVYADETIRYTTDPTFVSAFEFITAQQGNMKFKTNGTSYGGFSPHNKAFPAKLKMLQPNMVMKVTTMAMPYRFFSSPRSYITGGSTRAPWIGRVNQNTVTIAGHTFPRGSLQYMNWDTEMYTPPVPDRDVFFPGVFSTEKLMNLTLTFSYTRREPTDNGAASSNNNIVKAGHNLLPWTLTRKYHYAETAASMASWSSAPFELFWTDPDFPQTIG